MLKNILKTLRVNHYLKNIIALIPLIFSMNVYNINVVLKSFVIFISFCFISSVVYILNDIVDIKRDRLHPIKCNRPLASGNLPISLAITILIILFIISCFGAYYTSKPSLIIVLSYLVLNVFYSIKLKNIALMDVFCIALGFILRFLAGCFAIAVTPPPLIILLTFFMSMFFTFSKRKLELKFLGQNSKLRPSLISFNEDLINQFLTINAVLSIVFYCASVLDSNTLAQARTSSLYITVLPFTLIILHILFLSNKTNYDDPIVFFEKDKTLQILFITYFVILTLVLI